MLGLALEVIVYLGLCLGLRLRWSVKLGIGFRLSIGFVLMVS